MARDTGRVCLVSKMNAVNRASCLNLLAGRCCCRANAPMSYTASNARVPMSMVLRLGTLSTAERRAKFVYI